jgi:hypothetical protein
VSNIFSSLQFVFYACFFGTENDVLGSLPNNTIYKGRWMPEEHKIFMEKYEKYGNNCTLIAKVLNTRTPAQIKKHAECLSRQNLKTNSVAVKQYQESLSPDKRAQVLITHVAEQQNYQQSLSPEKKTQILCNDAEGHRKQRKDLPPEKKIKILQTNADAHNKKRESLSPEDKELFDKKNAAAQKKTLQVSHS